MWYSSSMSLNQRINALYSLVGSINALYNIKLCLCLIKQFIHFIQNSYPRNYFFVLSYAARTYILYNKIVVILKCL